MKSLTRFVAAKDCSLRYVLCIVVVLHLEYLAVAKQWDAPQTMPRRRQFTYYEILVSYHSGHTYD